MKKTKPPRPHPRRTIVRRYPTELQTLQENGRWFVVAPVNGPRGLRVEAIVAVGDTEEAALAAAALKGDAWKKSCFIEWRSGRPRSTGP
jgi:hypothetical protein